MITKSLLSILLIFVQLSIFGQTGSNSQIYITGMVSGISESKHFINIITSNDSTKIILRIPDSTSSQLYNDSNLNKYRDIALSVKYFSLENDTVKKCISKIDSIYSHYTYYSVDSIVQPNSKINPLQLLIQQVFNSSNEILENKDYNKNRVVLDGTFIRFELIKDDMARNVYARSPTLKSHPLLYELVTQTLHIYKQATQNNILKGRTLYY